MNSSVAATLPLSHTSSHHQWVRALFFSSCNIGASSSSPLPTRLSLAGAMHHAHDATRRPAAHRLEAYSPKCLVGEFCEVRLNGVLRSSAKNSSRIHYLLLAWARCTTLGGADHPALYRRR